MEYLWRVDEFDSKIFGFKVAKIVKLEPVQVENLVADLIKNKVVYATIRTQSDNFQLIDKLERCGFLLVDGIISLSLDISLKRHHKAKEIREARSSDLLQLKKLTTNLYSGTRITNDPFVKAFSNKYYITWVENSVRGEAADSVLVWEDLPAGRQGKDQILGYITLQKKGQIPLVGVSPKARGKGIAKKLINAALRKFRKWEVNEVLIETQMGNIPALRSYQGAGFKIASSYLTFRWAR